MTTFAETYDVTTPAGSDDPGEADNRMREIKAAVQEREDVDHYWEKTGDEVSHADTGEHRKITIRTLTAVEVAALSATKAYLYRLVTDGELYFKDASNNTIKLTSGGKILSASLDMKDEDDMATDSATHAATQQSIKAYADAVAAAVDSADDFTPSSYAAEESVTFPNGLILKQGRVSKTSGQTISFAVAFPNNVISAHITPSATNTGRTVQTGTLNTSGVVVTHNQPTAMTLNWMVWGY